MGFTDKTSLGPARCPSRIHLLLKTGQPKTPGMSYFGHLNVRLSSRTHHFRLLVALPIHFFTQIIITYMPSFLNSFILLCSSHMFYFTPHLPVLVTFLPALICLPLGSKLTPMNLTPLLQHGNLGEDDYTNVEEIQMLRLCALEFMTSLSESLPNTVMMTEVWIEVTVQCRMEGMVAYREEEGTGPGLEAWLAVVVSIYFYQHMTYRYLAFRYFRL
jgi:hypothetical protein